MFTDACRGLRGGACSGGPGRLWAWQPPAPRFSTACNDRCISRTSSLECVTLPCAQTCVGAFVDLQVLEHSQCWLLPRGAVCLARGKKMQRCRSELVLLLASAGVPLDRGAAPHNARALQGLRVILVEP